jgi:hypothetical protein
MRVDEFIERLEREMPGQHKTWSPLQDEELAVWTAKFPKSTLPEDLIGLLRRTNGIQFWVSAGSTKGYFRLLPLREIDFARQIMWGGLANDWDRDWVPRPGWLAISGHQDGDDFIVLDIDSHRYYLMDACGADLTCPAGDNVHELLDSIWENWITPIREDRSKE